MQAMEHTIRLLSESPRHETFRPSLPNPVALLQRQRPAGPVGASANHLLLADRDPAPAGSGPSSRISRPGRAARCAWSASDAQAWRMPSGRPCAFPRPMAGPAATGGCAGDAALAGGGVGWWRTCAGMPHDLRQWLGEGLAGHRVGNGRVPRAQTALQTLAATPEQWRPAARSRPSRLNHRPSHAPSPQTARHPSHLPPPCTVWWVHLLPSACGRSSPCCSGQ